MSIATMANEIAMFESKDNYKYTQFIKT